MNFKLFLCLVLVLSGGLVISDFAALSQDTNLNEQIRMAGIMAEQQSSSALFTEHLLFMGDKLKCHFTLEYRAYGLTHQVPEVEKFLTNDLSPASIPELITNLSRELNGYTVVQDPNNPKIIHIIEQALDRQDEYVMNKKISLRYSGNVANCIVEDFEGRNLVKGEGLVTAISRQAGGGIQSGTASPVGSENAFEDCTTVVNVNATNQSVRDILSDCLPLANYNPILWRAVTTKRNGEFKVMVQFYGK